MSCLTRAWQHLARSNDNQLTLRRLLRSDAEIGLPGAGSNLALNLSFRAMVPRAARCPQSFVLAGETFLQGDEIKGYCARLRCLVEAKSNGAGSSSGTVVPAGRSGRSLGSLGLGVPRNHGGAMKWIFVAQRGRESVQF